MHLTGVTALAMAADLIATGATFDPAACFVGVATNVTDNGPDTVLADVTEATGAMATRQAVTAWDGPYMLEDGRLYYEGPLMTFAPAGSAEAQTLTNWFVATLAVAGALICWGDIVPEVSCPDELHPWNLVLRLVLDPDSGWSAEVTFNG